MSGDEPARIFAPDITPEEQQRLIVQAYENLVERFAKLKKPTGEKESPAKTCRDLAVAYPEYKSGKYDLILLFQFECLV